MTEGSLTELGFQRWLSVQEVTGRPEPDCDEDAAVSSTISAIVGRSLVGVNEMHQEIVLLTIRDLSAANVSES